MKPSELKDAIKAGDAILLDVREKAEYEEGNKIEGSQNVPMGQVFVEAQKGALPKDKRIITICKTGGRCEIVARELQKKGYRIDHLEGGIEGWEEFHNK